MITADREKLRVYVNEILDEDDDAPLTEAELDLAVSVLESVAVSMGMDAVWEQIEADRDDN